MFNNDVISMHTREYRKDLFCAVIIFILLIFIILNIMFIKAEKSDYRGLNIPPGGVVKGDCENIIKK